MRKFFRDIIVRSAEKIIERERGPQKTILPPTLLSTGRASKCMFCTSQPTFQVFDENGIKAAFVCDEHVGPLATTWTTSDELVLVRL